MKVRFFLCTIIGVYQGDIVSFNSKNYCDGFNPQNPSAMQMDFHPK